MDMTATVALAAGAAWASGINAYAVLFMLGALGATGYLELPPHLVVLTDPLVIIAAGIMYCVEFFADKTPGVDSAWDAIHSFIRIPAGAILAAATFGHMDPALQIAAFLLGGGLAAASHITKAGSRILINTSPEPFTNWAASLGEDVVVVGALWTALRHPLVFLVLLALALALTIWALPRLWRGIARLGARIRRFFGGEVETPPQLPGHS
ncbi:MAG: DUF4126 domain-containing protein [Gammaproteobacteria bacterium]|nr:DUF4126 domain-containing protein [Gammaproteobacteria bacterium]